MTNNIDGTKELMFSSILMVILEYKIDTVFFHRKISIIILKKQQANTFTENFNAIYPAWSISGRVMSRV